MFLQEENLYLALVIFRDFAEVRALTRVFSELILRAETDFLFKFFNKKRFMRIEGFLSLRSVDTRCRVASSLSPE